MLWLKVPYVSMYLILIRGFPKYGYLLGVLIIKGNPTV